MLDQNTTTVLTTLVTVLGTLGGVLLGVILTNRYTWKQEKAKRNIPIIEEVYTLVNKINDQIDDCLQEDKFLIGSMKEDSDRVRTLVNLYLQGVKKQYAKAHWKLMVVLRDMEARYHEDETDEDAANVEEIKPYWDYRGSLATFKSSLEKLVD